MPVYSINLRHHFWVDAGIVGLYITAKVNANILSEYNVSVYVDDKKNTLNFEYIEAENLRRFLQTCYQDFLANKYWNVSTKKQKEKKELVMYDAENDRLYLESKRMATPIAALFISGRSWRSVGIDYNQLDSNMKSKVNSYLKETGSELWGKSKKLLFEAPVCHQQVKILPNETGREKDSTCCVCGKQSRNCDYVGQPSFLLFASPSASKSFNSQAREPARICWECDYLSKFALESVSYKKSGEDLIIIQVHSPCISTLINVQARIGSISEMRQIYEENFYANIGVEKSEFIKYASKPYEMLWAFFNDKYLLIRNRSSQNSASEELQELMDLIKEVSSSPVQIYVLHTVKKGKTFISKQLIIYNDIVYSFRLIQQLYKVGVNQKHFFYDLWDSEQKNNQNIIREKICKKILGKERILHDIEKYSFRKITGGQRIFISNILEFTITYETNIRRDSMNKKQIETAVNLGKQIIIQAVQNAKKTPKEITRDTAQKILKKVKNDLYVLRKTRTTTDFLLQLNNLQFRYGITLSNNILEGILEDVNFQDFKAYCIMGALNSFSIEISKISKEEDEK